MFNKKKYGMVHDSNRFIRNPKFDEHDFANITPKVLARCFKNKIPMRDIEAIFTSVFFKELMKNKKFSVNGLFVVRLAFQLAINKFNKARINAGLLACDCAYSTNSNRNIGEPIFKCHDDKLLEIKNDE